MKDKHLLAICDTTVVHIDSHIGRITDFEGLGLTSRNPKKPNFGYYLHPIYVVDYENETPYGIADVCLFSRSMELNPLNEKERKKLRVRRCIEEKESYKWVGPCINAKQNVLSTAKSVTFVMDREADIWEVFERIPDKKTHLVVRSKANRNILNEQDIQTKLHAALSNQPVKGHVELQLPGKKASQPKRKMELRFGRCKIIPSQYNPSNIPLALSYVEIKESEVSSKGKAPIHWILWTDRVIETLRQAEEIVEVYSKRWNIEVFFKLIKSDGFDIERSQLETGRALRKLALIIMEAAIRILQLKAARSGATDLKVKDVFHSKEMSCLKLLNEQLQGKTIKQQNPYDQKHLSWASWIIARLGGWTEFYDKRNPPGNKIFARGIEKFDTIMIGFELPP